MVIADVALNLFLGLFGDINAWTFIPTVLVALAYLLVPTELFSKLRVMLFVDSKNNSLKSILNQKINYPNDIINNNNVHKIILSPKHRGQITTATDDQSLNKIISI